MKRGSPAPFSRVHSADDGEAHGQTAGRGELDLRGQVVAEFKGRMTTHDVITYSAKARKHKQVYPFLRYGLVVETDSIPSRAFIHNEALDFIIALGGFGEKMLDAFHELVLHEVEASRKLGRIMLDKDKIKMFRTEIIFAE